ncbi:MAG: hypothetical protein IPM67_08740 [Sphingomonadales bacterium]|nr:hypothetical protein [Sphingomonadales bacterium]
MKPIASGLDILLSTKVERARMERKRSLNSRGACICKGSRCIVTLPAGVLAAETVRFERPLLSRSAKICAIRIPSRLQVDSPNSTIRFCPFRRSDRSGRDLHA